MILSSHAGGGTRIRRWVAFAPLCFLLCLALACAGSSEPVVQQGIQVVRTDYDTWLRDIGAAGATGELLPPWIVAPEHGSEVSGEFEVIGWSARPSDVRGVTEGTETHVRVFVMPEAEYVGGVSHLGHEVTSSGRRARVDPVSGEWRLMLRPTDMPTGLCAVVAVTEMETPGSSMRSSPMAITLESPDGLRKATGDSWPAPSETVRIACVMARPKGEQWRAGDEQLFRRAISELQSYVRDASRGRVEVVVDEFYVHEPELRYGDSDYAADWKKYIELVDETLDRLDTPGTGRYSVIVAQPGGDGRYEEPEGRSTHSWSWSSIEVKALQEGLPPRDYLWQGSYINMPIQQSLLVGALAHELFHGLGMEAGGDVNKHALPDLYAYAGAPAAYTNLDSILDSWWRGYDQGAYFLMVRSRSVLPSGYSQTWLGWLEYADHNPSTPAMIEIPYLDGLNAHVAAVPRIRWSADGRDVFTVLEARSRNHGRWDDETPASGVAVYKVRDYELGDDWPYKWPRSINWCDLLVAPGDSWVDLFGGYTVTLEPATNRGFERARVTPLAVRHDSGTIRATTSSMTGVILVPNVEGQPSLLDASEPLTSGSFEASSGPMPDLDLHAYLEDGRHIGIDYETGRFENPVDSAIVSGDMVMDAEWIVLPDHLAHTARFEISARDISEFEDAYPELIDEANPIELEYSIQPIIYDEVEASVFRGPSVSGSLSGDAVTEFTLASDADKGPAVLEGDRPSGPPIWRLPVALGVSALLLLVGLVLLFKPLRRN